MIRVGLAGYGLAGSAFHAPLIRACERMELSAVLTSREAPSGSETFESCSSARTWSSSRRRTSTHFDLASRALKAGKHVVIDKPFTVTLDEADELIALAQQRERVLTVFHNRRWDSDFLTVAEAAADGSAKCCCSKRIGTASGPRSSRAGARFRSRAAAC